jgi:hypothetical protein
MSSQYLKNLKSVYNLYNLYYKYSPLIEIVYVTSVSYVINKQQNLCSAETHFSGSATLLSR